MNISNIVWGVLLFWWQVWYLIKYVYKQVHNTRIQKRSWQKQICGERKQFDMHEVKVK